MKEENDPIGTTQKPAPGNPQQINPHTVIVTNPVVSCRIEGTDGAVLYNPDTDTTVLINPTGLAVWTYLDTPHTLQEITGHLITTYNGAGDPDAVLQDVVQFLTGLGIEFIIGMDTDAR